MGFEKQQLAARNTAWHTISSHEVLAQLNTSPNGLSNQEAEARLKTYGPNKLPEGRKRSALMRFLLQFHNILIYVLLVSAIITAFLDHWADAGVIIAVVTINAVVGFIQEGKAEEAIEAIRHMLSPKANILRSGRRVSTESELLVPGDIVLLEAGDKVPADLRLLTSHGLAIQEAMLTGESIPVEKSTDLVEADAPLGDRSCMAFSGTLVTSGQALGVVVATGLSTEIGRINRLLSEVATLTTPLLEQMSKFARKLTFFILSSALMLLAFGYFVRGYELSKILMIVIGLSVSAIPEGLPSVLTITLAIGVQVMAKRNAIVRRLPAIETLGSVSVICTDKTGTLTRNEMMVSSVVTAGHLFSVEGFGYEPKGALKLDDKHISSAEHKVLEDIARAAVLCNNASLRENNKIWQVEGDPMEGALLAFAEKVGLAVAAEREAWGRIDAIAFDSKYRFMATLNKVSGGSMVFVKGAPESILSICKDQLGKDGKAEPLNKQYWHDMADRIAANGQRVLAFASKLVDAEKSSVQHEDLHNAMTMLGMVGMIDPPRAEAISAIAECHDAGIRIKMITGDHSKTAAAIGKQIGLQNHGKVLTGVDLDSMDDEMLSREVVDCDIFARTTPEHKLRLVMALQSHGMTVAMTGDGVNDAPALKRAEVGVAMGHRGSEVAKEAAEIVLADDNFASIAAAVREGRTVYDNITKVISWTLPTNAGEAIGVVVALLLGLPIPITPIQILWINLVTAVTLGIALSFEPTEESAMRRPPRLRNAPLLNNKLIEHIIFVSFLFLCGVFGIYYYAIGRGYSVELAQTMVLNTLVSMEIFHLLFIRNIYNNSLTWENLSGTKVVRSVIAFIILAQVGITYTPQMQAIFSTVFVPFEDIPIMIGIGVLLFAAVEIKKQMQLRLLSAKYGNDESRFYPYFTFL